MDGWCDRLSMMRWGWLHRESEIYGRPRGQSRIITAGCGTPPGCRDAAAELPAWNTGEFWAARNGHVHIMPLSKLMNWLLMPRYKFKQTCIHTLWGSSANLFLHEHVRYKNHYNNIYRTPIHFGAINQVLMGMTKDESVNPPKPDHILYQAWSSAILCIFFDFLSLWPPCPHLPMQSVSVAAIVPLLRLPLPRNAEKAQLVCLVLNAGGKLLPQSFWRFNHS